MNEGIHTENETSRRQENLSAKDYFEQYWRYCSAVRNWLVAFGVGGCILLISEKAKIFQDVCNHTKAIIVTWFIAGVIAQILLALLNKYIHWCVYWGKEDKDFGNSKFYIIAERVSSWFWIDILVDLFTIIAFAIATLKVFKILY